MNEVYNPESVQIERLEALSIEARRLAKARDQASGAEDRQTLTRQLGEVEQRIDQLRKWLRERRSV